MSDAKQPVKAEKARLRPQAVIALIIVVLFLALVGWKIGTTSAPAPAPIGVADPADTSGRPSMVRDDSVAAYESALKAGKPIYVLFHSLTCEPCVEISAVADDVVSEYADTITFVNAITDDPGGQLLAGRFSFQYIPTSFFVAPDGTVVDSFTGVLQADEMRARLDALIAR